MLLTPKQQLFMIHLLEKRLSEENQYIYAKWVFRRYINPLIDHNLIRETNGSIFKLTWKGVIMARLLAGLLEDEDRERFDKYAIV